MVHHGLKNKYVILIMSRRPKQNMSEAPTTLVLSLAALPGVDDLCRNRPPPNIAHLPDVAPKPPHVVLLRRRGEARASPKIGEHKIVRHM